MEESDLAAVLPYVQMYNTILKCKNLGLQMPLDNLTMEDLDLVHEFYTTIEEVRSKKGK